MSHASYWAARQQPDRPLDKLVLIAFADHADKAGECFPSVAALCEWTGCDRKTVMKSTASLEAAGLLLDTGRRCGRTRQVKVYRLPLETVPETAPLEQRVPETAPLNSTVFLTKGSQKRDTEPPKEPTSSKTTSSQKKRARSLSEFELPDWIPADAWNGWLEMRLSKTRTKTTIRALELAVEELRKLADAGHPPGAVLDQSTMRIWTGLFEIKEPHFGLSQRNQHALPQRQDRSVRGSRPDPALDMLRAARAAEEAECAGDDWQADRGAWPALPSYRSN